MRIISGKYGRRRINIKIPPGVRPTTDNVKETLFNILNNSFDFNGAKVLDIFAGSGLLGFEALSRGASFCYFIEKNRRVAGIIKRIADELKVPGSDFAIADTDFNKLLKNTEAFEHKKFDLIFADPPYALPVYNDLVKYISDSELLSKEGIIILESSSEFKPQLPEDLKIFDERVIGSTKLTFIEIS